MKVPLILMGTGVAGMIADSGDGGAAVVDAFAQSGPSLAGLGALALTIYKWLGDIKNEIAAVKVDVKNASMADQSLRSDIIEMRAEMKDVVRRVERVEREDAPPRSRRSRTEENS